MIICRTIPAIGLAFFVLLGTGCRERAELEYKNEQLQLTLGEHRTALQRIEAELAALPNLGRYSQPQRGHIQELKNRIQGIKDDSARLNTERDALRIAVDRLQTELDAYQTKFARR